MFSYKKLWKLMIDREVKKGELRTFLSSATIAKLGKDEYVSMEVLDKLCSYFGVNLEEIVEHIPDKEE
ncbi:helix-turn-helix domain-containing protein [Brevibacillus halotolerans]|uniref:helix-turn-helix domain-containing protein n=1 Tax=Brevibacillus halotolerans TaxID=1507437 RepID=UPI0015EF5F0C|nr:helix-turn-helix transcriptional regulator [Brevibacillus halotolerans]MBA4534376.1 helix-turn-helix transcriptional regulator [Brevibacillus halotolerans]